MRIKQLRGTMLRITENLENPETVRLRLDGTVSLETLEELEGICIRYQQDGKPTIMIDMTGVTFMTGTAAQKLARLCCDSLRIINCSPFIAALLNIEKNLA